MKKPGPNVRECAETMFVEIVENPCRKAMRGWRTGGMGEEVMEVMERDIPRKDIAGVGGWKGEV